jgi:murein DD-endopeptidase MepM/ murein hydrolase activator NlpD
MWRSISPVIIRVRGGVYAAYEHIQPGSVRVRRGERVRPGQVIGLVGNSGNSSSPHLHFGIQDRADLLTSKALPFEFDQYRFQGMALPVGMVLPSGDPTAVNIVGTRRKRRSYPSTGPR